MLHSLSTFLPARLLLVTLFPCLLTGCLSTEPEFDVIVIGGGLMGSSTAWQLAAKGQRVLLLEKQGAEYTEGSSLGETRISRSLGGEEDIWSYMHNRTVAEVSLLIDFLNSHEPGHSMTDVYRTSPVNYVRHSSHAARIENIQENQQDRYAYARTPAEATELFDLAMPEDTIMWREYKEHSGTINPEALIALLHKAIGLQGGEVRYQRRVEELSKVAEGYRLWVSNTESDAVEMLQSAMLVTAAGPYTGSLLADIAPYFDQLITPRRPVSLWPYSRKHPPRHRGVATHV